MDQEIFKQSLDEINAKIGPEQAGIIADNVGVLMTAQKEALDKQASYESQIEELKSANAKLISANANLLRKIPVVEENEIVPAPSIEPEKPRVNPFDEFGRLKK